MFIEARVVPLRVNVVPLYPALESLETAGERQRRLATEPSRVDPIAQRSTDRWADGHTRLDGVRPLPRTEDVDVVEEDSPETLRSEVPSGALRSLLQELLCGSDSIGGPPDR